MSNFLRKGKKSIKGKIGRNFNSGKKIIEMVKLKNVIPHPTFNQREEEEKKKKQLKIFKGKSPIECLEINGYEVFKDLSGNVIVGVDKSYNLFEGINEQRSWKEEFSLEQLHSIPMEKITDYNSLWEITKSGWDSKGEVVYPYIFILNPKTKEKEVWRWDNSNFLRVNCLTHNWEETNYQKYFKSNEFKWVLKNQPKN